MVGIMLTEVTEQNFDDEVCPVDARIPDPDHEESKEQLLEKWYKLHPGETPAYTP